MHRSATEDNPCGQCTFWVMLLYFQTGSQVIQAIPQSAMQPRMALNSPSSGFHFFSDGIQLHGPEHHTATMAASPHQGSHTGSHRR